MTLLVPGGNELLDCLLGELILSIVPFPLVGLGALRVWGGSVSGGRGDPCIVCS